MENIQEREELWIKLGFGKKEEKVLKQKKKEKKPVGVQTRRSARLNG